MDQMNTQGNFETPDTMNEDQLDQLEQSDRMGGSGTMLGNQSTDQVDGTDQNEVEAQARSANSTQMGSRNDMDSQTGSRSDTNSYSGMPTDSDDASTAWSASSGVVGGSSANRAEANSGLEGDTDDGVSNAGLEDPQVQRALDPNGQGNGMGNGKMAKDPVCGAMVDTTTAQNTLPAPVGSTVDTLYFDSPECKALFEANPDQYIANY